jgi:hypothetical protein
LLAPQGGFDYFQRIRRPSRIEVLAMTPAQPLIPFLSQLAETNAHDADEHGEFVTIARADLRSARPPQLPRAPLFSQRRAAAAGAPARGSSPDLRRR